MDKKILEYIDRRMDGSYNRSAEVSRTNEYRRRRKDGTFMRGNIENSRAEMEYDSTDNDVEMRTYNRSDAHRGPDDEKRRRIGFGQGGSHWSEEEFVGDMEESLYHEVDDIYHYLEICKKVYDKGYEELANVFYEIANEKYICAESLKHRLKKIGRYNPSEHEKLEEDLKHVKPMFR